MERFNSFLVIRLVRILWKDLQSLAVMLMSAIDAKGLWLCIYYTQRQRLVWNNFCASCI